MFNCGTYGDCEYELADLKNFVAQGVDLARMGSEDETIWEHVCSYGGVELIDFCMNNGCPIDGLGAERSTPLMLASMREGTEELLFLLEKGATVNAQLADGQTALFNSIYGRDTECFDALIKAGANPNAPLQGNVSILMAAAANGRWAFIDPLLDAGASAGALDDQGKAAWDYMPPLGRDLARKIREAAAAQEATAVAQVSARGIEAPPRSV